MLYSVYANRCSLVLQGDKNLVYAELMLKPSADAHSDSAGNAGNTNASAAAGKDATEYAEIVYFPPTAGKDVQKLV